MTDVNEIHKRLEQAAAEANNNARRAKVTWRDAEYAAMRANAMLHNYEKQYRLGDFAPNITMKPWPFNRPETWPHVPARQALTTSTKESTP